MSETASKERVNDSQTFNLKNLLLLVSVSSLVILLIGIGVGEWLGWPFLAKPLEQVLTDKLERRVSFSANSLSQVASTTHDDAFSIRFLGGLSLKAPHLEIAAPAWSKKTHLILANNVTLNLRYIDLWRAYKEQPVRIEFLQASDLDVNLERLADGRASWQFSKEPNLNKPLSIPSFGSLQVVKGFLTYRDVPFDSDIKADFSFDNTESATKDNGRVTQSKLTQSKLTQDKLNDSSKSNSNSLTSNSTLQLNATGHYRKLPLKIELLSSSKLSVSKNSQTDKSITIPVSIVVNAKIGRASVVFNGGAENALQLTNFAGQFKLKGPSMAAVGDIFGVTLPTTAEFTTGGNINKKDSTWHVKVNNLDIGATHLDGEFTYETGRKVPLLSGKLSGSKLLLTDLGPAFGAVPVSTKRNKVLPTRPFDLAALRVMDANVLIDIKYVDLNSSFLEPLKPLRGHLLLKGGVLTLQELLARTAEGTLKGNLSLDGRGANALWDSNLRWGGVRLERWVKQKRDDGLPPYISGKLNGQALLKGQGRSTAEILASLNGHIRTELRGGSMSHFVIELAGLDVAESMGILFKGDDALPVQCAVVDLVAQQGVLKPKVMVIDTKDSAVWVDGSLSLATEVLNLRAMVMPKDFSPLTLRAPLQISGTFADPKVSLDKQPIGVKLAASLFLGILNPLAALIPLFDTGDTKEAKSRAADCQSLMKARAIKPKEKN